MYLQKAVSFLATTEQQQLLMHQTIECLIIKPYYCKVDYIEFKRKLAVTNSC